jgi:competence protein ComEC
MAAALQQGHRASGARLSSIALQAEQFLNKAETDRLPWLAVGFAGGIGLWFALANSWLWCGVIVFGMGLAGLALAVMRADGRFGHLRLAVAGMGLAVAAGCGVIWAKSAMIGTPPITGPMVSVLTGRVLDRYDQGAEHKVRLEIATREPETGRAIRVRLSMPLGADVAGLAEGAVVRRARLIPPGDAALPGAYDAARQAWFDGIAATGTVVGPVTVVTPASGEAWLTRLRHALSAHVHGQVAGSAGGIAAAFASGDRGGISLADEQAMRDSGLTHLLSVSGLHVSAVIAGAYVLAARLLGLFPWLALRMRLPLVAGGLAAGVGMAYALLTGAQVPTVRSLLGAFLVLAALALGRQPLSLGLLAVVAICVMALWPEAVVGPSFQMSFGAVLVIGVVSDCAPVRAFLAPRDEAGWRRIGRHLFMILLTGMVIDLALMPVALFHFHRAGIYGAMANLVAIPLTTFVSMPAIAAGLAFDLVGLGGPAWWVCGASLNLLLAIARWVAQWPDAVTLMPPMGARVLRCLWGRCCGWPCGMGGCASGR